MISINNKIMCCSITRNSNLTLHALLVFLINVKRIQLSCNRNFVQTQQGITPEMYLANKVSCTIIKTASKIYKKMVEALSLVLTLSSHQSIIRSLRSTSMELVTGRLNHYCIMYPSNKHYNKTFKRI